MCFFFRSILITTASGFIFTHTFANETTFIINAKSENDCSSSLSTTEAQTYLNLSLLKVIENNDYMATKKH